MPVETFWALSNIFSTFTGQSEPITWSTLLETVQQFAPYPWLWIVLGLIGAALLFLLDVGSKLSGILRWLGFENPFQRLLPAERDLQKELSQAHHGGSIGYFDAQNGEVRGQQ